MASDFGDIMDALVMAAETVGTVTAERTIKYAEDINAEDFPFCCVYDPREVSEEASAKSGVKKTSVNLLLFTKGETQEATALKIDAVRDAVDLDPTLGGVVEAARVSERTLLEEPGVDTKAGYFVVEVTEQTGHLISTLVSVELQVADAYTDWSTIDSTLNTFVLAHVDGARLSSNLVLNQDAIGVGLWRYQIAWTLSEAIEHGSNASTFLIACEVKVHYHIAAATSEATLISGTMMGKIDGLLEPANWKALTGIHDVAIDTTPVIALSDLERVD